MNWLQGVIGRRARGSERRWVVLDVEASGLDAGRDRLLAIAALAVHVDAEHAQIALADSFEVVLRQPDARTPPDKANILLHGIGVAAQRHGIEPAQAIDAFMRFVAQAPLVGFHVAFDRALIERSCTAWKRPRPGNRWLDLAPLAALLQPQAKVLALDDWLAHFRIRRLRRHHAAAGALATAELLLHLWPLMRAEGATSVDAALALAARQRWLAAAR